MTALLAMIGTWILTGGLFAAADIATAKKRSWKSCLGLFIEDALLVNLATLFVLRFGLAYEIIIDPTSYLTSFCWKYIQLAVVCGVLYLLTKLSMRGTLMSKPDHESVGHKRTILMVIAFIFAFIGSVALFGAYWFHDYTGEMTAEQILFNFASPVGGAPKAAMLDMYSRPVFLVVFTMSLLGMLLVVPVKISITASRHTLFFTRKQRQFFTIVVCFILAIFGISYAYQTLHVDDMIKQYSTKSGYFIDNYVDPASVKLSFPKQKRNLVHIYVESVETSYLDKAHGGYMDKNLMPDLMELAQTGIHFSHTNYAFGGPHQVCGTGWSVAGMTNMNFGIPLKAPRSMNSYGQNGKFLPGAIGYTDILAAQDYNETITFGADAHFGGLDTFYSTHGTQTIFDLHFARKKGLIPPDYMVWWGFEDNKLYEYAKSEMTRLYNEGKPFCFMMENADTHFPDGFKEPETKDIFGNQYANVIFHSQKQVADLIRWIQAQPFGSNTTIVVTGDHLSMDGNFFKGWDPSYERTTFNMFINPAFTNKDFQTTNRQYTSYDYMPTILSSLGIAIEGERLALGTNLASQKQTLVERDGLDHVNEETSLYSDFYVENLLTKPDKK